MGHENIDHVSIKCLPLINRIIVYIAHGDIDRFRDVYSINITAMKLIRLLFRLTAYRIQNVL